jgi:hypothetical protein
MPIAAGAALRAIASGTLFAGWSDMTSNARRLLAFFGPTAGGTAVGIDSAMSGDGGGRLLLGVLVGAAVGATFVAFVPDDRR